MALPATDNFNRSDSASLGANWTQAEDGGGTPLAIVSNKASFGASSGAAAYGRWSADAFNNDHFSEGKIYAAGGAFGYGPIVRASATPTTCYWAFVDSGSTISIYRMPGFNLLGATFSFGSWSDGDLVRLSATGTTLELFLRGSSLGTRTDGTLTSGSAGIGIYALRGSIDDWQGDNVAAGGGAPTYPQLERGIRGLARGVYDGGVARSMGRRDRIFVPAASARQGVA